MNLKICYVTPDVQVPSCRGASTHVLELSRALVKLGDEVHVICRRSAHESKEEQIDGVTLHRIYRGLVGPLKKKEAMPSDGKQERDIRSFGYFAYLTSVYALFAGLVASSVMRDYGVETVIERETAFGAGAFASMLLKRPLILEMIGPRFSRLSLSVARSILAYNDLMVPREAKEKTVYVKAAVNTELFRPDRDSGEKVRNMLGLNSSDIVIGYVGTFQRWHGLEDILKLSEMMKELDNVKFLLVGPVQKQVISKFLSDRIKLTGPVAYKEVPNYINAFDIAVAPYKIRGTVREEKGIGSSLKILEYMACEKPVVASSLPQVADIIQDGRTGLLFPEGDVHAFREKVKKLIEDPYARIEIARNGLRQVANYTWKNFASQVHRLLELSLAEQR